MEWWVAVNWKRLLFEGDLLGIWRAQQGPGPFSLFYLQPGHRVIEVWSVPDEQHTGYGRLVGKWHEQAKE